MRLTRSKLAVSQLLMMSVLAVPAVQLYGGTPVSALCSGGTYYEFQIAYGFQYYPGPGDCSRVGVRAKWRDVNGIFKWTSWKVVSTVVNPHATATVSVPDPPVFASAVCVNAGCP